MGPYPSNEEEMDPEVINAGKETVTVLPGSSFVSSSESFGMIRGRHCNITILGALEISKTGDLASWIMPGKFLKGMGGSMDLVGSGMKVVIAMRHVTTSNKHKILESCSMPLTGKGVISLLITDMAVFDFTRPNGMTLIEIEEGYTLDDIRRNTGCNFEVASDCKTIKL